MIELKAAIPVGDVLSRFVELDGLGSSVLRAILWKINLLMKLIITCKPEHWIYFIAHDLQWQMQTVVKSS